MGQIKKYLEELSEKDYQAIIAKALSAKSPEELIKLAKENGIDLKAEKAKGIFDSVNPAEDVSDNELAAISAGCGEIRGC